MCRGIWPRGASLSEAKKKTEEEHLDSAKRRRLMFNNDGGTLVGPTLEAPIGVDGLVKLTIDPLKHTHVDTLVWTLGTDPYHGIPTSRLSDWYSHDTQVGSRWGSDRQSFSTAGGWRIYENARDLLSRDLDVPAVIIDHGRQAGLEVFLSMRVNDMHDGRLGSLDHEDVSPSKKQHPEWLLGRTERSGPGRFAGWSQFGYSFDIEDVRGYKYALAEEAVTKYEPDGLEWDFCRFPRFFPTPPPSDAFEKMTGLIRRIREMVNQVAKARGGEVAFSVRVPPSLDICERCGLDVRTWIAESLIDIVVVGMPSNTLHLVPAEPFVKAASGSDVQVFAESLQMFRQPRPLGCSVLWGEPSFFSDEMRAATAANNWQSGVDGLYLFNNHLIEFHQTADFSRRSWAQIGDPTVLSRLDKHYIVDSRYDPLEPEMGGPTIPGISLPQELMKSGDSAVVSVCVADDFDAARADGALRSATLRLMIQHLTARDKVQISLDGTALEIKPEQTRLLYNECWIDFDVSSGPLRRGENQLEVTVVQRNAHIRVPLVLEDVEVLVTYAK